MISDLIGQYFATKEDRRKVCDTRFTDDQCDVVCLQYALNTKGFNAGELDGIHGTKTQKALEQYQDAMRLEDPPEKSIQHMPQKFPRQRDVVSFYGEMDRNQVMIQLPYKMQLSWDTTKYIQRTRVHRKVADSAVNAFNKILNHYGQDEISRLRLDVFGGGLNVRLMRSGNRYSMHSWGIAFDFDPENNRYRWGNDQAAFARPEYEPFFDIWENEGWISLGRELGYDWMHVQAARL